MSNQLTNAGLAIHADVPPLRFEQGGVIRVGQGRLSLDLIVEQYESGMSPEEMVRAYDTLDLADAYATIAYYLRHRDEVRAYIHQRVADASNIQASILQTVPRVTRDSLIARRDTQETDHAQAGQ